MNMFQNNNIKQSQTTANSTPSNSTASKSIINKNDNTSFDKASTSLSLNKGTVLKGIITDIRNNEITIKLDSNKTLTAKISNPPELTIGQSASFKVVDRSVNTIYLEVMDHPYIPQDTTITKALEGAALPNNEQNMAVVTALLNNQMSIDKQSILNLLRQSLLHKDTSINSLALMQKHNLPITAENVKQFNQYLHHEHRIIKEIYSYADSVSSQLVNLSNTGSFLQLTTFHSLLMDLLSDHNIEGSLQSTPNPSLLLNQNNNMYSNNELLVNTTLHSNSFHKDPLSNTIFTSSNLFYNTDALTSNHFSKDIQQELINVLEQFSPSEELKSSILDGSANLRTIAQLIQDSPSSKNNITNPLLNTILDAVSLSQRENNELASFLTIEERDNLITTLKPFHLPEELIREITTGNISTRQLLEHIKNLLPLTNESAVRDLFQSYEYKMILKEELISKWTLTPKELSIEGSPEKLYRTLSEHLSKLNDITSRSSEALAVTTATTNTANYLKDNIDFMKTLNQMFTYIQLPLKFKEQHVHSDLYVYTNKKQLQSNKENISVLLHLDMEHLGPLDIHITLAQKNVISKFYLNDENAKKLVLQNITKLEEALFKKGYSLQTEVLKSEKEVDLVKDFIEKDSPMTSLKRYSFDIRA